jgi:hypothetical protein
VFVRDWAWRNRLLLRFSDLSDASIWDDERFDELWHFDPRWVLGDDRYRGHAAVPALRGVSAESLSVRRFRADTLAAVAETTDRARSATPRYRDRVATPPVLAAGHQARRAQPRDSVANITACVPAPRP